MKNILVTGGKGQLGMSIQAISKEYPEYSFKFLDVTELDITCPTSLSNHFISNKYDVIINCAAYTNVDKAETEQEKALMINAVGVRNLTDIANAYYTPLIHISTDYVFDGNGNNPIETSCQPYPLSAYGKSKLQGEKQIIEHCKSGYIIIRTSWLYSEMGNNFLQTVIRLAQEQETLKIVFDQIGTPTYARDLARVIIQCLGKIDHDTQKIFHYSNEGVCSWYDFSKAIIEELGLPNKVLPIMTSQYPTPAKRPYYSVLDKEDIKNWLSIEIPHWIDALRRCIKNLNP